MVPYKTQIIAEQDVVIIGSRNKLAWPWESPAKTPYILAVVAYISKTNAVTPIFYCWKVITRAQGNVLHSLKHSALQHQSHPHPNGSGSAVQNIF